MRQRQLIVSAIIACAVIALITVAAIAYKQRWFASSDLPAATYTTTDGEQLVLRDLRGRIVIANFWATWCPPCRDEIPDFVRLQQRYPDDVIIIGFDTEDITPAALADFLNEFNVNYPIVPVRSFLDVAAFGDIIGLPTTRVYDKRGNAVIHHSGPVDFATLDKWVACLNAGRDNCAS